MDMTIRSRDSALTWRNGFVRAESGVPASVRPLYHGALRSKSRVVDKEITEGDPIVFTEFPADSEFSRMLAGGPRIDLARIALEIAEDLSPGIDHAGYLAWIDAISQRVRERCPTGSDPRRVLGQINWALFVEEGFRGNRDDYYDPRNSYLNEVIDRKMGIPISLCVLYGAIADRLGLELPGVNFPVHFMLKHDGSEGTVFIDPFHGELLDLRACERRLSELLQRRIRLGEEQVAACPPRLVVARMLRNLKTVHLHRGDLIAVLSVQRRLATIHEEEPAEQRDLGLLLHQLGRLDEAVAVFQEYLRKWGEEEDAAVVGALLREARREIVLRN